MRGHILVGLIIIVIGLSILFNFPLFNFIIAFIILWIGIRIIVGRGSSFSGFSENKGSLHENYLKRVLVFSGINSKLESSNLEGMELVAIFGGGEIDARGAKTAKKTLDIELVAIFGGIKLAVPKTWKIESQGAGILGAFENHTNPQKPTVTVNLRGTAFFGGVEVVN